MNGKRKSELSERVAREAAAHDEEDVLAENVKLKRIFRHVQVSPTMRRFESDYEAFLQDVKGLRILDLGCGHGDQSLRLIRRGAVVSGIDISNSYIKSAQAAARDAGFNEAQFRFAVMDAHNLEFPDDTFDIVVGRGILHHLDLDVSLKELNRVLKPGGRALFREPLAANPLLKLFRKLTPKARTVDEKPLTREDLDRLSIDWNNESLYYGLVSAPVAMLTSLVLRPFDNNFLLRFADWIERKVNGARWIQHHNQYVLLSLVKR
jgi:SAM-dependent methyltransferase